MINFNEFHGVFNKRANAVAFINGSDKYPKICGKVFFYTVNGGIIVRAEISGLPNESKKCNQPIFAFHIHSGNECSGDKTDAFAKAGVHYNPNNCPHPFHAGDLPPLFSANGKAFSVFFINRFTLAEILGKTIIIHSGMDDFTTQPSGGAGEKIACGIINPTAR